MKHKQNFAPQIGVPHGPKVNFRTVKVLKSRHFERKPFVRSNQGIREKAFAYGCVKATILEAANMTKCKKIIIN